MIVNDKNIDKNHSLLKGLTIKSDDIALNIQSTLETNPFEAMMKNKLNKNLGDAVNEKEIKNIKADFRSSIFTKMTEIKVKPD